VSIVREQKEEGLRRLTLSFRAGGGLCFPFFLGGVIIESGADNVRNIWLKAILSSPVTLVSVRNVLIALSGDLENRAE